MQFVEDSKVFYSKCQRPEEQTYYKKLQATFMGVLVMGFIGYMIKLIFIPINNIILSN